MRNLVLQIKLTSANACPYLLYDPTFIITIMKFKEEESLRIVSFNDKNQVRYNMRTTCRAYSIHGNKRTCEFCVNEIMRTMNSLKIFFPLC